MWKLISSVGLSQTWLFQTWWFAMCALFGALLRPFALFAPFCALLCPLRTCVCPLLRSFAHICERPGLERPRLGTSEGLAWVFVFALEHSKLQKYMENSGKGHFYFSAKPWYPGSKEIWVLALTAHWLSVHTIAVTSAQVGLPKKRAGVGVKRCLPSWSIFFWHGKPNTEDQNLGQARNGSLNGSLNRDWWSFSAICSCCAMPQEGRLSCIPSQHNFVRGNFAGYSTIGFYPWKA